MTKLREKEDEVFSLVDAGHFLDIDSLRKAVILIKESKFIHEYMSKDTTFETLTRTAKELNKQLQEIPVKQGGQISFVEGSGKADSDAAEKYAAGCLVVAAVAAVIPGGQPIAAAFGIAGAVAGAAAAFSK